MVGTCLTGVPLDGREQWGKHTGGTSLGFRMHCGFGQGDRDSWETSKTRLSWKRTGLGRWGDKEVILISDGLVLWSNGMSVEMLQIYLK